MGVPAESRGGEPAKALGEGDGRGIFAGLFLAEPTEVESWGMAGLTPSDWPAVDFKQIETVKLGTLEASLTNRSYDDIDQDQLHSLLRSGGEEGPCIASVRHELVASLATLTPASAASAAAKWADTDEFKIRPTDQPRAEDIADLTTALLEMADLARQRGLGQRMYLLMSL